MLRVELPDGQWADLKEIGELRRGDRKFVLRAVDMEIDPKAGKAFVNGASDDDQLDALLMRIVTNWSLPYPLPSMDPSSLDKLTLEQGKALAEAAKPYLQLINEQVDPAKKGTDPTAG